MTFQVTLKFLNKKEASEAIGDVIDVKVPTRAEVKEVLDTTLEEAFGPTDVWFCLETEVK